MWQLAALYWQGHNILLTIATYCHKCDTIAITCHCPIIYNMSIKLSVKYTVLVRGMFNSNFMILFARMLARRQNATGRSCDQPSVHRGKLAHFPLRHQANAVMLPKVPLCIMQPFIFIFINIYSLESKQRITELNFQIKPFSINKESKFRGTCFKLLLSPFWHLLHIFSYYY